MPDPYPFLDCWGPLGQAVRGLSGFRAWGGDLGCSLFSGPPCFVILVLTFIGLITPFLVLRYKAGGFSLALENKKEALLLFGN